ncbi:MAG: alpha/beta fold hydrolase [Chitinophagales bacterium]|nr:alpha/beta fold hydrolase [Chitinophagales bacterium]
MQTKLPFRTISVLITISLMTSCSFNKLFLQPTKIPFATQHLTMKSVTDTELVVFSGAAHQPVFLKKNTDTISYNFTIESVLYKSKNGNTLNGWLLKSKNITATTTLLHLHGNGGCLLSQFKAISPMVEKGFQVFMFDYSGFGFSEGKPSRNNVLTDALSTLDYIKTREDVKNTKILLYGQSLGGHLAAVVAAQRSADIDGLITEGAFSSHKDIGGHMVPVLGKIFVKQGYSALKSVKEYHKPLLVIHSTEDSTIPFSMGKKLFDAANEPKEFYEVQKCHICAPQFYATEIAEKINKMLLKK